MKAAAREPCRPSPKAPRAPSRAGPRDRAPDGSARRYSASRSGSSATTRQAASSLFKARRLSSGLPMGRTMVSQATSNRPEAFSVLRSAISRAAARSCGFRVGSVRRASRTSALSRCFAKRACTRSTAARRIERSNAALPSGDSIVQILAVWSMLPEAIWIPSRLMSRLTTPLVWPRSVSTSSPDSASQSFTVRSSLAVASRRPSGKYPTAVTSPV